MDRVYSFAILTFICLLRISRAKTHPVVILGDFISLPGGRGNIAEFGKALRLPSFSETNIVQFHQENGTFYHRFVFHNTIQRLIFPFRLGETMTIVVHGKTIEYDYNLELSPDPDKATLFAKYEEIGGRIRFTVEAVFSPTGMVTTYTHSDVLDNIMARRTYRRIIPKPLLGYYENVPALQSKNFAAFSSVIPVPEGASYSTNNKIYLGQFGKTYIFKDILDPEIFHSVFPFGIGVGRKLMVAGKTIEYIFHLEQHDNSTVLKAKFADEKGQQLYHFDAVCDGEFINVTYKRGDLVATRTYRRALPLHFLGRYEAVAEKAQNLTEFSSVYLLVDSVVRSEAITTVKFYRQEGIYHQEIVNVFGSSETIDVAFELNKPVEQTIRGQQYMISYSYDGGEKPELHISLDHIGGDLSCRAVYVFDGTGFTSTYKREAVTATQFYRRLLPVIVFGKYESVNASSNFNNFANGIFFPELTSKTTMEYFERNKTYVQKFSYGPGVSTTFQEVPFILGEKYEQLVKNRWLMEYTYQAYEGERTFLRSVFTEKTNGTPTFGEFSRIGDFTESGYTSTYVFGNTTARRTYRRVRT